MKNFLATLVIAFIATLSFSQTNHQDVVYLKNGSIIQGVVVEQDPDPSIKIEKADRNVFDFQLENIEKNTEELIESSSERRRGYIGLVIGPSIPVGDFADKSSGIAKTGVQINLINLGYLFTENFGVSATWYGAANPVDVEGFDPWSYGGLMAGALLSFPIAEKIEWDFRPMIGYSVTSLPGSESGTITAQESAFAFIIGTTFRLNAGEKVSLLFNTDYFSTKPEFFGRRYGIRTLSLGFGVAYRLK